MPLIRLTSSRRLRFPGVAFLALLQAAAVHCASADNAAIRDLFKQYIEVRTLIGEERAGWESEKNSLSDMVAVLQAEIAQLESSIKQLSESATTADQKRGEFTAKLEAGRALSTAFNERIAGFESKLKSLTIQLPEPLVKDIQPLLARLPDDPANTRLSYSQRLQTVIGVLAQTDKFNSDVKYVSAVQPVGTESIEVQTLYFGLGGAIFADPSGKYAGHGYPTSEGWKWVQASAGDSPSVLQAIDVYLSRKAPAFVSIPLKVN